MTALIVYLDTFGREALDGLAMRRGGSREGVVRTAALYYLADAEAGRVAWQVPGFASAEEPPKGLNVRLDDVTRRALAKEAERQGVPPGTLAAHALLYFAADLDSGHLGGRLEHALQDANPL